MAKVIYLYSDLYQTQPINVPYVYNVVSIEQSIDNILVTTPGERFFLPSFGCNLRKYLWEFASDAIAFSIYNEVLSAIERWETRVRLVEQDSRVTWYPEYMRYLIDLRYIIPSLSKDVQIYQRAIPTQR